MGTSRVHSSAVLAVACYIGATGISVVMSAKASAQEALEEVIVSARKRAESLQEAPVSVTAFTTSDLAMRGAFQVDDLYRSVPNVSFSDDAGLQIRGIGYNTRNIGIEGGATVYVDGAYTGRFFSYNQGLVDVASMEVLRGPQGTLFGKNSIAGVINITTQKPSFESFSGNALASYGNDSRSRGQLTLNVPISSTAAFRIAFDHDEDGGYVKNLFNGSELEKQNNTGGRAAFRWAPSSQLEVTLRGNYLDSTPRPAAAETLDGVDPQTPPPRVVNAPGRFTTMEDTPTEYQTKLKGASATVAYTVSDAFTLTSVSGYEKNELTRNQGSDNSALNRIEVEFSERQEHFTQELRGSGAVGALDYVAGLFYFHQSSFQDNKGILGTDFAIPPLGIPGGIKKAIDPIATIKTESYAAFADLTYKLAEVWELELGGRINREKKDIAFQVTTDAPALFYAVPFGTDSFSDTDFSPTAGVRYHFNKEIMGYLRYAKGYKSGGWNADFASTVPGVPGPVVQNVRFDAETATTYEAGLKSELFDNTLTLNAAVFYTDFSNLQVSQFNGINLEAGGQLAATSNAGEATIKGAELEASWLPVSRLRFTAGVGYTSAVYDKFDNAGGAGVSAAGKEFPYVPRWTGNASGQYAQPLSNGGRFLARADFSYIGERYDDVLNDPRRLNPSYWVANARLGYVAPNDRWQAYLWSYNVTDHRYIQGVGFDQFAILQSQPVKTVTYGRPISYGIEFQVSF